MKRRQVVIVVTALAAIAIGLLVVFGARDRTPSKSAKPRAADVDKPAGRSTTGAAQSPDPDRDVDVDDDAAGTLRLEGQVIDADAAPVGGATVTIDSRPSRTAVTEADGSFAFDQLIGRPYELVATSGDLVGGPVTAQLTDKTEPVILRLAAGATVEVTIASAKKNAPIAGATVELHGLLDRSGETDAAGLAAFRGIAPGWYLVAAHAPGYARSTAFANVTPGTSTQRLELVAGAAVAGRVVDADARPVAGAKVRYEGVSDWTQAASDAITTGADGTFRIDALPPGSFRFTARHDAHAPGATDAITLDGRTAREDITIRLPAGATITGRVVDRGKAAVAYARVRVVEDTSGFPMHRTRQTTADASGAFSLAGLPRGKLKLVALHDSATTKTTRVDLAGKAKADVELVLDLDGVIAGVVVDTTGEPVEGAQVWASVDPTKAGAAPHESGLRGEALALTDSAGAFSFRGLVPGRYAVRTHPPGATSDHGTLMLRKEVEAQVGDTALRIVLPADGSITGKVVFADGKVPTLFSASLGSWGSWIPISTTDGSFTLRDLPPRDYRVTIRGPGFAEKTLDKITVVGGAAADAGTITVQAGRSISGRVVDANGKPVAGATVLAGPFLWGTGSRPTAPAGMGGPPGAGAIKSTTTDERGEFALIGVGRGPRHVVADHEAIGRSVPISVPPTDKSVADLQLTVVALGALEGKVTMNGGAAERIVVNAQSKSVPETMYSVVTGDDGSYRFDRLAPDTYSVSAMTGSDPMAGFGFHSRTTTVASNKTTRLDLVVAAGDVTLAVTPTVPNRPVGFAFVHSVKGVVAAKTYKDLERQILRLDNSQSSFGMAFGGNPASIGNLSPGDYTTCAAPYPDEVGADEGEDYLIREGDNLPVFCKQITITPSPARQTLDIPVEIPPYVPAPADG